MKKTPNKPVTKKHYTNVLGIWTLFDLLYWPISVISGGGKRRKLN